MAYFTVEELRVATPCERSWNEMEGDDYVRHCTDCKKNVYDVSMLTRAEANELIREKEGQLCVRYYRRFDGTVLTADCPVGLRRIRKHYLWLRSKFVVAALTIWAAVAGSTSSCDQMPVMGVLLVPDSLIHRDSTVHRDSIMVPEQLPVK